MKCLQHQPVAAQRHDDVGLGGRHRAVALLQLLTGIAGGGRRPRDEGEAGGGRGEGSHPDGCNAVGASFVLYFPPTFARNPISAVWRSARISSSSPTCRSYCWAISSLRTG